MNIQFKHQLPQKIPSWTTTAKSKTTNTHLMSLHELIKSNVLMDQMSFDYRIFRKQQKLT